MRRGQRRFPEYGKKENSSNLCRKVMGDLRSRRRASQEAMELKVGCLKVVKKKTPKRGRLRHSKCKKRGGDATVKRESCVGPKRRNHLLAEQASAREPTQSKCSKRK